jgi:hypothetical protein|tara:strand:+ start:1587 stop:1919 length:333 start_codon:yes stop_codon:yes gene_type:complete
MQAQEFQEQEVMENKKEDKETTLSDKQIERLVIREVYKRLGGQPENVYKETARNLWSDRHRVNIWTWKWLDVDTSVIKKYAIEYSYFVRFDKELKQITHSLPEIEKIFED